MVDDAIVTDIVVQNLRGLPKPPETLRLHVNGTEVVLSKWVDINFYIFTLSQNQ